MKTIPTTWAGMSGTKISCVVSSRAAAARMVGPVHGRKLTPAASPVIPASLRRSIPSRSNTGSIVGMVMRKVTAPFPSRCARKASVAVPTMILTGFVPTRRSRPRMIGSNMPASPTTPKNAIAKTNMAAIGATPATPWRM